MKTKNDFKKGQIFISDDFGKGKIIRIKKDGIVVLFGDSDEIYISYESMGEE